MKITDVDVVVLEAPDDYGSIAPDGEPRGIRHSCVFVVSTDEGITGYSQVETQPHVAQAIVAAPSESSGLFSGLRSLAVGQSPMDVEALWDRLFRGSYYYGRRGAVLQAISGIDIACWDILGKATGLSVATLLGSKRRTRVRAYASTLFRESPAEVTRAAEDYVDRGFTAVKFGWGPFGDNLAFDVSLVEAARAGVGSDVDLMVDAGWRRRRRAKQAIASVRAIEHCNLRWVEEPCFPEDLGTYRALSDAVGVDIAAGEAEVTSWDFRRLAEVGGVDVLQPDLSRCGGLTVARRIAYMADEINVAVCPHAWGSEILTAATLQFVCFLAEETLLEFNTSSDAISRSLVTEPLRLEAGHVELPTLPGLGVEVDWSAIERLRA